MESTKEAGPLIHVAIVSERETQIEQFRFTGHSDIRIAKAAKQAINCLRLFMLSPSG
ncbi:MAG: hypothetical protein MK324_09210 [Pirellulales bacterium]|nr:hypothetical protein [Pirellulales bacterium]